MVVSCIALIGVSLFPVSGANATTQQPIVISAEDSSVQPQGAQVAIFFGGIVAAWIADGVITYATGRPPAEWITMGLTSIEQKIKSFDRNNILSRPIYVSSNGQISGCIVFPCAVETKEPVYE